MKKVTILSDILLGCMKHLLEQAGHGGEHP